SSRTRHTSVKRDWSSDVCSSDLHRRRSAGAMMALRAAIEGLEFWNQTTQLAIALAEAEYAISRVGTPEEADDLHERFEALPFPEIGRASCREAEWERRCCG